MVHVPFFGIDLPEPRLGAVIPDTVSAIVNLSHKAIYTAQDALLSPEQREKEHAENQERFEAQIPREFDRVRKRYAEGKIVNSEQLSSELEDASFDWYRRQLRISVLGETDDELEDVAARKLGLQKPSALAAVQNEFLEQRIREAGGVDMLAELNDAAVRQLALEDERKQRQLTAARAEHIRELRQQVKSSQQQAIGTLTSATGGALLAVLLCKGLAVALRKVLRGKKPPGQRPAQQPRRPASQQSSTHSQQELAAMQAQVLAAQQRQRQGAAAAAAASAAAAAAGSSRAGQAAQAASGGKAQAGAKEAAGKDTAAAGRKPRAPAKKR